MDHPSIEYEIYMNMIMNMIMIMNINMNMKYIWCFCSASQAVDAEFGVIFGCSWLSAHVEEHYWKP